MAQVKPCQLVSPEPQMCTRPLASAARSRKRSSPPATILVTPSAIKRRRGRRADLVADDAQLLALQRQPGDRAHEILALRCIDPAGAEDQKRTAGGTNGIFAGELGLAVDAERARLVVLAPGPVAAPVIDIVGREMDQRHAMCGRPARDDTRRFGVDAQASSGSSSALSTAV